MAVLKWVYASESFGQGMRREHKSSAIYSNIIDKIYPLPIILDPGSFPSHDGQLLDRSSGNMTSQGSIAVGVGGSNVTVEENGAFELPC